MIENELLFLGLLKESPKHGYEIKTKIQEILSLFAGIEAKSIYYPLKILEQKGLVIRSAGKAGRRPLRFVYSLTPKGESRFDELLNKSLLNLKRPQFSLDLSLYFLHHAKTSVIRRRLRARALLLKRISRGLKEMIKSSSAKKPPFLSRILEHNLELLEAESRFLSQFIQTL